jgi:hypothetical protein
VDVRGGRAEQDGAAVLLPIRREHGAALAFHGIPGVTAQLGELEPPVGFDFLDHRAERVNMRGERARGVIALAGPGGHQRALARERELQPGKIGQRAPGKFDTCFGHAGGAGRVEQTGGKFHQKMGVDLWQ